MREPIYIGFAQTNEVTPSEYHLLPIAERKFSAIISKNTIRHNDPMKDQYSGYSNDELRLDQKVSVIFDTRSLSEVSKIRYVKLLDSKWKVTSIVISKPRVTLTLGGVYNG